VTANASRALLARLIDHAPLFPPASLPLEEALAEDRRARESPENWMLGRLAWPASRLAELGEEERELTIILDAPFWTGPVPGTGHVHDAPRGTGPVPGTGQVQAVEGRGDPAELAGLAPEVYVEDGDLDQLSGLGLRAKVRCGGERVPSVEELAAFVRGCRERGLPFKATAGLHHAVRRDEAHGFVNLLAAAVFGDEEAALAEEDAGAFALSEDSFSWRDRAAVPAELARARDFFVGFGSCSFFEPVEELRSLRLL
jgi:hypothetical protein